jgi:hypothetical protein
MKPKTMKLPNVTFLNIPDTPLTSTTQNFLPIADITNDIVLFKDGGAALVMEATSLNFGLLSEKEQEAVIAAYAALINSLSFPIQIVVKTQRKDISIYMQFLEERSLRISNPKLKALMENYKLFIKESIKKKNVLSKKFYVVIPFSPLELGVTKSILSITKTKGPLPFPKSYVVKKAKILLYPRRDHLIRQMGRLGIKIKQLTKTSLVELYYWNFNLEPPTPKRDSELLEEQTKTNS